MAIPPFVLRVCTSRSRALLVSTMRERELMNPEHVHFFFIILLSNRFVQPSNPPPTLNPHLSLEPTPSFNRYNSDCAVRGVLYSRSHRSWRSCLLGLSPAFSQAPPLGEMNVPKMHPEQSTEEVGVCNSLSPLAPCIY